MDYYVLRLRITCTAKITLEKALCDNFTQDPVDPETVYTYFNKEPICVSSKPGVVFQYHVEDEDPSFTEFTIWDESEQAVDTAHKPAIIDAAVDYILEQEHKLARILKELEGLRNGSI